MARGPVFVSKSRHVWTLAKSELYFGEAQSIRWTKFLPDDYGTKAQRELLLKSAKALLQAMVDSASPTYGHLSPNTARNWFEELRRLVRWMVERNKLRFENLTLDDMLDYAWSVRLRTAKVPSRATIHGRYAMFHRMWALRGRYNKPLSCDPALADPFLDTARRARDARPWQPLDEGAALALLQDAIQWLQVHGASLTQISHALWLQRSRMVGASSYAKGRASKGFFRSLDESGKLAVYRSALADQLASPDKVFARVMTITEGACLVVGLMLLGCRAAELLRLDVECLIEDTAPDGTQLKFVKGIAAKRGDMPRRWVAADPLPSVVSLMADLHRHARKATSQNALFVRRSNGAAIVFPGSKANRLQGVSITNRVRAFVNAPFRADRPKIKKFHAHMARKTFARFVVLRDKRVLESLAYHFGHVHRFVTDHSYVGSDIGLASLLAAEERRELVETLENILSAPRLAGKAGERVTEMLQGSQAGAFRGKRALRTQAERLIKQGVNLAPCDWGYCVYSQPLSACKGSASGPTEALRSPDVCSSCANFAVTERHLHWWNERLEREQAFLRRTDISMQAREIATRRLQSSIRIVSDLVSLKGHGKKV